MMVTLLSVVYEPRRIFFSVFFSVIDLFWLQNQCSSGVGFDIFTVR